MMAAAPCNCESMRPSNVHRLSLGFLRTATAVVPELEPWLADPQDPALSVMRDFRLHPCVSVGEDAKVDHALKQLKLNGVRSALVTGEKCYVVVGLVTTNDLCGDKLSCRMRMTSQPRRQVLVRDIMEPIQQCGVIEIDDLEDARVADVAVMFAACGRSHVPVVETDAVGRQRLRGMLSYARVRRVLAGFEDAALPTARALTSGPWHR
jgi:CBS-domain-containing membrane protein